MNGRRQFIKLAPALATSPLAMAAFGGSQDLARGEHDSILGTWNTVVTLPFPPGSFREFASFAEGGVLQETNTYLHASSSLDYSAFGLPMAVSASDGFGNWTRLRSGVVAVHFRKLLFDGSGVNFGDLLVTGTLNVNAGAFHGDWQVQVVDPTTNAVVVDFGVITSQGTRLR